ncbi:glycerophosphodiester phosphodiesterase [Streptomyces sp. ME02-6979.5a]|uniref:glycerophosphodiester phosphodiesterase n=1 Tax=Streptomyces sp. ME02-6979.5a TaxID=462925 RepID=UPI0029BE974C|nr:glycerophosphodiester phosphodiesterase [Streptomyces sp. ME02-6979.5a]MDX3343489.1 glycerophosphodiester phosphodiesterase [Streptomyces sp. ME02-6979.5a]
MATVTGKLVGGIPSQTRIEIELADVTGTRAIGYAGGEEAEVVRPVLVKPQTDGTWSADLIPNAQIQADAGDTVWAVMEGRSYDGTPVMTYIVVPETGGPHWVGDLRVDLGDAPTGGSTIVYVPGPAGDDGQDGTDGLSAYEVWLEAGNTGTQADYLASLVGPSGAAEAQEYTDTAVAAEATRADAAYDPAGSAAAAQSAATAAASSDASAKADAARDAAISSAAADAAAKANTAQSAAVSTAASSAAALYLPNAIQTVDAYLASATPANPRFFGHRGGGMVRPEHTLVGYRACAAMGFALEVSVNVDASGELWCLHDLTLDRTTYQTGALNTYTTEEVGQVVLTNGRTFLGPGWTDQRMVPLRQVLDEFLGRIPILLEPKGNDAVVPCQDLLDTHYPHAPRSVIWKAHIGTLSLPWAKSRGYRTWVYLDSGTSDATMDGKDANVDYWGVSTTFTDLRISQVVARGKPVFAWPVYRRSQVTRLTGLGVVGMMSSDPRYVSTVLPQRTFSRWELGIKETGGTPTLDYDEAYALKYGEGADAGWVSINALPNQSYGLGTYSPIQGSAAGYRISFDMKYPVLPASGTHGGYYFGKASDDAYRFTTANATGGYHVVMRASGDMELYRHTAGVTSGTRISDVIDTDAPVADTAMSFEIDVTPTTVELRRTDGTGWTTGPIADTTYRGGYHGLSNGSITDLATRPFWRNLVITQL